MIDLILPQSQDAWNHVSPDTCAYLRATMRSSAAASACRTSLANAVLAHGVCYSANARDPTPEFDAHVRRHWPAFCRDFLDAALATGFALYTVVKADGLARPVVLVDDDVTLGFRRGRDHTRTYAAFARGNQTPMPNVFCAVIDPPGSDGEPASALASVVGIHDFVANIRRHVLVAESIRANPPVLTKNKTDHTFDNREMYDLASTDTLRADNERQNLAERNRINVEMYKTQNALVQSLNENRVDSSGLALGHAPDPAHKPQFIPLPNDADVAAMRLPQARQDVVALERYLDERVSAAFGVPSIDRTDRRSYAGVRDTLDRTVSRWQDILSNVLMDIYRLLFDSDAAGVSVCFPNAQDPEVMTQLYDKGLLAHDEYARYMAARFDIAIQPPAKRKRTRRI